MNLIEATESAIDTESAAIEEDTCDYYATSTEDFVQTSLTTWYRNPFLRPHTMETLMLELPGDVLNYLIDERMDLPRGVDSSGTVAAAVSGRTRRDSSSDDDWSAGEDDDSEEEPLEKFQCFDDWIAESVQALGGAVFPKINWKCPKDATWVAFNKSLKCYIPGDVYLLLKCSSQISNVLDKTIFSECSAVSRSDVPVPSLILRKWVDISPAAEFRCFVINGQLTGISQRDTTASYSSIKRERDSIIQEIHRFFRLIYKEIPLTHYSFDVVRMTANKLLLLDLNVFGLVTDPCLFNYKELESCFDEMSSGDAATIGEDGLVATDYFGNPVFKFIDNDKMLKFRSEVNAGPTSR